MVDVAGHSTPCIKPVRGIRPLEDLLGDAVDAAAQESPNGGVDQVDLLACQRTADGLHEPLGADGLELLLLGPFENAIEDGASGDEVAFGFALSGEAAFDIVETVLFAGGQLVVEEAFALLQLGAERLLKA